MHRPIEEIKADAKERQRQHQAKAASEWAEYLAEKATNQGPLFESYGWTVAHDAAWNGNLGDLEILCNLGFNLQQRTKAEYSCEWQASDTYDHYGTSETYLYKMVFPAGTTPLDVLSKNAGHLFRGGRYRGDTGPDDRCEQFHRGNRQGCLSFLESKLVDMVIQLSLVETDGEEAVSVLTLSGTEILRLSVGASTTVSELFTLAAAKLDVSPKSLKAVLPSGQVETHSDSDIPLLELMK